MLDKPRDRKDHVRRVSVLLDAPIDLKARMNMNPRIAYDIQVP